MSYKTSVVVLTRLECTIDWPECISYGDRIHNVSLLDIYKRIYIVGCVVSSLLKYGGCVRGDFWAYLVTIPSVSKSNRLHC